MDALSELLRIVRLDSAIFFNAEFCEPWCLRTPAAKGLTPLLAPAAGHVIIYHLLCEGSAYVEMAGGERVELVAGDVVTFPHGDPHTLGGGLRVAPIDGAAALPALLGRGLELAHFGGCGASSRFICGFLACDPQLCQSFLGGLPPVIKVNIREDEAGRWLESSLQFSVAQAADREPGASAMLTKLSEAVFSETLRRFARALPAGHTGWFAGARDPEVGRALTLLHHRPAHPWTVTELARASGLSRTVLSERFRLLLGESPMRYLTRWRLRLGARELTASKRGVAQIASEAGYESEAAFNRAFKREFGQPPATYRKDKARSAG